MKHKISIFRFISQLIFFALTILGLYNVPLVMSFALISAIILGPIFCGWICVFGAFQDWLNYIGNKLKLKQITMPAKAHNILKYLRYFLYAGLITTGGLFLYFSQIRMSYIFSIKGSILIDTAFWSFITIGVLSLFTKRFYCKYLCPLGAKFGFISLLRPLTINKSDKCIECNKCNEICPMQISVSKNKSLVSPNCINCYSCIEKCPVDCLKIGRRDYKTF